MKKQFVRIFSFMVVLSFMLVAFGTSSTTAKAAGLSLVGAPADFTFDTSYTDLAEGGVVKQWLRNDDGRVEGAQFITKAEGTFVPLALVQFELDGRILPAGMFVPGNRLVSLWSLDYQGLAINNGVLGAPANSGGPLGGLDFTKLATYTELGVIVRPANTADNPQGYQVTLKSAWTVPVANITVELDGVKQSVGASIVAGKTVTIWYTGDGPVEKQQE